MTLGAGCALVLVVWLVYVTLNAMVLWGAWNWIAVPLFHAPHLTFFRAALLGMVLATIGGFFKSSGSSK